jgi:hypothetical protein
MVMLGRDPGFANRAGRCDGTVGYMSPEQVKGAAWWPKRSWISTPMLAR